MLRGGADKLAEAGAYLAGGHSIDDDEPKYGMAVTGLVHPERVVTNAGARPGDALVLTKPLGTGIVTTGIDRQLVAEETVERVVAMMGELNRAAAEAMLEVGVHACTDVTGFGLLGHLRELAAASGVSAEVWLEKVPVMPEAWELVRRDAVPDGTRNNHRYLADHFAWDPLTDDEQLVLCDAQTSGGLLIAVGEERRAALLQALESAGVSAANIGVATESGIGRIRVRRS